MDPATFQESPSGLATSCVTGTETNSAWLARSSDQPSTASPTEKPVAPSPSETISPEKSLPSPQGKVVGYILSSAPMRIAISPGLIAAALTLTIARPGIGCGPEPREFVVRRRRHIYRNVPRACLPPCL